MTRRRARGGVRGRRRRRELLTSTARVRSGRGQQAARQRSHLTAGPGVSLAPDDLARGACPRPGRHGEARSRRVDREGAPLDARARPLGADLARRRRRRRRRSSHAGRTPTARARSARSRARDRVRPAPSVVAPARLAAIDGRVHRSRRAAPAPARRRSSRSRRAAPPPRADARRRPSVPSRAVRPSVASSRVRASPRADQAVRAAGGGGARGAVRVRQGGPRGGEQRAAGELAGDGVRGHPRAVPRPPEALRDGCARERDPVASRVRPRSNDDHRSLARASVARSIDRSIVSRVHPVRPVARRPRCDRRAVARRLTLLLLPPRHASPPPRRRRPGHELHLHGRLRRPRVTTPSRRSRCS